MINKFHLVLATLLCLGPPALAQTQDCIAINYVGAFPDKPFTGEFHTSDSTPSPGSPNFTETERIARDREGRIRDARSVQFTSSQGRQSTTLAMPDGTTRTITPEAQSEVVLIVDCPAGTRIQLQPAMQIARITSGLPHTSLLTFSRQFSSGFCSSAGIAKPNPQIQYEELGIREIQGIVARGCRYTILGAKVDGEWEGKPIRSDQQWVSDDLGAFLLIVRKDLKTDKESRMELINIKLGDPDPALFKIPDGYLINPTTEQMPKVFGSGQPVIIPKPE